MINIHLIRKNFYKRLFPPKFGNKRVQTLYNFISKNDNNFEHWELGGLLTDFINIIKIYDEKDTQDFFDKINLWNSYYLVIISDKFLDNRVKSNVTYDFGNIYAKIFLSYENFDSYFLIDNLEIAITMYNSKLELTTLIDLISKINLLHHKKLITKQQHNYNIAFINRLKDEVSN
ncbi:hypothetical protein [Chryseobacterium polytrichastri]|uniref:Uncharacterized protein n=1 Tax=Chryseobacterium polytrichastri TaxID=1302687 RepID=A0A1M6QML6_9FLAO|nr:hypothetical protein [Chryseobacterium polytrichastri]SHK21415.1 hypothetical protein SAMN05444267_100224 [Chryseobacterium polytrichastri]